MTNKYYKFVPLQNITEIKSGSIVRLKSNDDRSYNAITRGQSYVVTAHYGDHATAINSVEVTDVENWEVLVEVSPNFVVM